MEMDEVAMAAAIVTFEFDTWGTWRTSVNGIMVAWHMGYDPWDWGPSLMESLVRGFSARPGILDEIASRFDEEIVQ